MSLPALGDCPEKFAGRSGFENCVGSQGFLLKLVEDTRGESRTIYAFL